MTSRLQMLTRLLVVAVVATCLAPPSHASGQPGPHRLEATATGAKTYEPIIQAIEGVFSQAAPTPAQRVAILRSLVQTSRLNELMELVPNLTSDVDVGAFLRRAAGCAAANQYLTSFWKALLESSFRPYADKPIEERIRVVPQAVLYAVMLDRITTAVRGNSAVYERLYDIFAEHTSAQPEWKKYVNTFEIAKKYSVDGAVKQYLRALASKQPEPSFGKNGLPLNIVEAVVEDYRRGVPGNAEAGLAIAFEHPGQSTEDPSTGAGPTRMSDDGNVVWLFPPLPKDWADIYQTWNMNFVASYDNAPMFFAKLANPAVLCYADTPQQYLFHRVVSLYVHIHYEIFTRLDRQSKDPGMEWRDDTLVQRWSEHNEMAGQQYQSALDEANPDRATRLSAFKKQALKALVRSSGTTVRGIQRFIEWIVGRDEYVDAIPRQDLRAEAESFGLAGRIIRAVLGRNQ